MTETAVTVRVRLFAIQRELAGTRSLELGLADGATVEDAWSALVERVPALAPGRPAVRFAVNGAYADPTTSLADGDELACIPPVSGGAADGAEESRRRIVELRAVPFEPGLVDTLVARLATDEDGGVVAFVGRTRVSAGTPAPGQEAEAERYAGRRVERLEYEAHESMALRVLDEIANEIEQRSGVHRLAIVHRLGEVPLGEASVVVVAVAPHRDAAFRAARYAIDETKARVPIWKAEQFRDGHVWVGEPARTGPADDRPAAGADDRTAGSQPTG
ncbi:MAG: molybdenum cofactor biosynthesis protein MoaE [Chloroflexota bacterium]